MGGLGFMSLSGVPAAIGDFGVLTTGGGDNVVLAQQTARYLIHGTQNPSVFQGSSQFAYYAADDVKNFRWRPTSATEVIEDFHKQLKLLQLLSRTLLAETAKSLENSRGSGDKRARAQAWNENAPELVECALLHSNVYWLESFIHAVDRVNAGPRDKTTEILNSLCQLFGATCLQRFALRLLETSVGGVTPLFATHLREGVQSKCKQLRPFLVRITDAFDLPDGIINSPIGAFDGDLYHNLQSALEKVRNGMEVVPFWDELLAPLTTGKRPLNASL